MFSIKKHKARASSNRRSLYDPLMLFMDLYIALLLKEIVRLSRRLMRLVAQDQLVNLRVSLAVFVLVCLGSLVLFSPAYDARAATADNSPSQGGKTGGQGSPAAHSALKFSVDVKGQKLPDDIKAQIEASVQLGKDESTSTPTTLGQLRRRANDEARTLNKVLRSQAYFSGRIEPIITEAQGGAFDLTYIVTLGVRTMIESFAVIYSDHPSDEASLPKDAKVLGLVPHRAARAQRIIDLTNDALVWLQNHGHPTPKFDKRDVIVDLSKATANITLAINAGAPKYFGPLVIKNEAHDHTAPDTSPDYIRNLATFKTGELYDKRKADATVAALRNSNLFDQVTISLVDANGVTGKEKYQEVTPELTMTEAKSRSVGLGARWSSDEGAGVTGFWEHRNLFGRAEKLRVDLSIAQTKQSATTTFTKPHFLRADQSLVANFEYAHEDTDAYNEDSLKTGAALSRALSPTIQASAGLSFEIYRTEDSTGVHSYRLFGVPLTLRYNGSDDLLDPTEGSRLNAALTPYVGKSDGAATAFSRFEAGGSTYYSFGKTPDVTLAFRGRYGLMLAKDMTDVPGSLRFYAGGGGSIRGYGYQLVGPLDAANDPVGGRSVLEGSTELRYRLTETIGVVAFVDGGNAYSTVTPQPGKGLQWGAGIGLRYYTPIGPVRADIAMPLNRRPGFDDPFQVYFSLGQAF